METFHEDPFVNATLNRLNNLAGEYLTEHKNQTDVSTSDFLQWKAAQPLLDENDDTLPDTESLASFVWDEADPSQLIALVPIIDEIRDSLNRALRRAYNGKGGDKEDVEIPDLSDMRAKLVRAFDGIVSNIESGVFEDLTVDDITNLPNVGAFKTRTVKGGGESEVWPFPKAPKTPSVKKPTNGARNLRTNNRKVKLMINGAIPNDYPLSGELGDAMGKYLRKSVQEAAPLFNNYRIVDNAAIYTADDGTVYGLTTADFTTK